MLGATLVRRFIPLPPRFSLACGEVCIYVTCVMVASAVAALWGATCRASADRPFWLSLRGWFLGDVLASLVLAPTILLYLPRSFRIPHVARRLLGARLRSCSSACSSSTWSCSPLTFRRRTSRRPCCTSPVPWLVWAAVRFGPRGLMSALSLTTVLAIAGVVDGLGPFVARRTSPAC